MRLPRSALSVLACAALLILLAAGCQSGAQQDLIARELRMQEDKLYAMEDYLSQYQQLVCKYRSENAALKRQLSKLDHDEADLPAPDARSPDRRPAQNGPSLRDLDTLPEQAAPSARGQIEVVPPEVPPLETSTENGRAPLIATAYEGEAASGFGVLSRVASRKQPPKPVTTAKQPKPRSGDASTADKRLPQSLVIRGEVVENNAGGGPRLAVHVEPLDAANRCTEFAGTASLMLLAPQEKENRRNLARWDFSPEEVHGMVDRCSGKPVLSFYLEVPPDIPFNQATEVWVRLLPRGGPKLLAHAAVNLQQPGAFSSVQPASSRAEQRDSPTSPEMERDTLANKPGVATSLVQSQWTIARPDQPANSPDSDAGGQWRASSEVIPVVAASASMTGPRAVVQAEHVEPAKSRLPPPSYMRPSWTPDRPGVAAGKPGRPSPQSASLARRPSWSATR